MYQINIILTVVLLSSVFDATFGEEIDKKEIAAAVVPEPKVSGVIGHAVNISCKSLDNYPLRSCRWERLNLADGKRYVVNVNSHGINGSTSSSCANCKYEYVGKGLHEGDCTISIKNATEFHAGNWECLLFGKPVDHTWIGQLSVELDKNDPIGDPFWENENDLRNIIYDQASPKIHNISCCVKIPAPSSVRLQVDYDNKIISTSLPFQVGAGLKGTYCVIPKYEFLPQNSGKLLTCSALFSYQAQEHVKKTSILIDVKFGPQISMNSPVQYRNDSNAFVAFEFSANPKPVWEWFATNATDVENEYVEIKDDIKYALSYVDLKDDNYTATLKVKNVTEDDYMKEFKLQISNKYGTKELYFKIVNESVTEPYWMMIMIGIGAVAICLVFFIVLFISLSKRNIRTYSPTPVVYNRTAQNAQIETINSVGRT